MIIFEVKIGDLILTQKDIEPPITGLSKPTVRTSTGNYSGRDGGWLTSQFYSTREIVIKGSFDGLSCDQLEAKRQEILTALPIRQSLPMFITDFTGKIYYTDVYFINLNMDVDSNSWAEFEITLLATDPYIYDAGDGTDPDSGYIIQTIYKLVGGGYIFPYILPVIWEAGSTPTSVNNTSDVIIYPIITMTGKFTNPRVTNNTTGTYIEIGITTTDGDVIEIDMKNRTVTLNGGSILPYKTGNWLTIIPGINMFQFETDGGSDNTEAEIKYRIAYEGI